MGATTADIGPPSRDDSSYQRPTEGVTMMTSIMTLSTAVITGFTVEWLQRKCELWAIARDRNL